MIRFHGAALTQLRIRRLYLGRWINVNKAVTVNRRLVSVDTAIAENAKGHFGSVKVTLRSRAY